MVKAAEDKYSVLPGLTAVVSADTVAVGNPAAVTCAVGGTSAPAAVSGRKPDVAKPPAYLTGSDNGRFLASWQLRWMELLQV